jgi:PQQ-like domain
MTDSHRRRIIRWLAASALCSPVATAPAWAYDWLQFGGNAQHSGNNTSEKALTAANVASLTSKFEADLPSVADSTPVFLEAVSTPTGVKNLVFVTTRDGWIVALDAQTGVTAWSHQNGPAGCKINNGGSDCYTTSSPAIDPNRQFVYSYGLEGFVHKYQVGDGTEVTTGGWPALTSYKGYDEKASSALSTATSGGVTYLYVTHAGYPGDRGDYQGHVTAINLANGAQKVFNAACSDQPAHMRPVGGGISPTCATHQNAMWSRPGVIYDPGTDRIFIGTGNAFSGTAGQFDGNTNWSESVLALHPDATGGSGANAGKPLDSYTPTDHGNMDGADNDIGSTAPAMLPVPSTSAIQHLAVQGGKDSTLRLLNLQQLSSLGGPGQVGGEVPGSIIDIPQGGQLLSQPAVWINPADNSTWIFVINNSGASALRLNFDVNGNPSLVAQWHNGQSGTSPVIANNMVFFIGGSVARALDPITGAQLWSAARGGGTHWQSVIVANRMVYATDQSGHLDAFGLSAGPAAPALLGVVSRKTHAAAGVFDLNLSPVATNPTTEPRLGPLQTVVFQFDKVVVSGTAAIGEGTAGLGAVTFSGTEMTVNLSGVDNQQYITVAVSDVAAADGGTGGTGTGRVGYLACDVNQNRVVSVADLGLVNAQLAQSVSGSNFLKDVNASGTLSVADVAITNTKLTTALPAP